MDQPMGFEVEGKGNLVCKLNKSLYGLKQAPRCWYKRFDEYMNKISFVRSQYDACIYFRRAKDESLVYLLLYVDDMFIVGRDPNEVRYIKEQLSSEFETKDLGPAKRILGMIIDRRRSQGELFISQSDYTRRILTKFNMLNVLSQLAHPDTTFQTLSQRLS